MAAARAARPPPFQAVRMVLSLGNSLRRCSSCPDGDVDVSRSGAECLKLLGLSDVKQHDVAVLQQLVDVGRRHAHFFRSAGGLLRRRIGRSLG